MTVPTSGSQDISSALRAPSVAEMHSGPLRLLREHVDSEPVILSATAGMGEDELARSLLADTVGYTLDPQIVGGDVALLVARITRNVIEQAASLPIDALDEPTSETKQAYLEVVRQYGAQFGDALAVARGEPRSGWSLTDALALGDRRERPLIVARNTRQLPQSALWELRDLVGGGAIRLLLLSRPGHEDQLLSTAAPFFGMGVKIGMPPLSLAHWAAKLPHIGADILRALLEATRYRTAAALEVAEEVEHSPRDHRTALGDGWISVIARRRERAYELLRVAAAIHELAPRLLLILAHGRAPYSELSHERPGRVSLALRRLREYELIEQPRPRTWQIADPLLSGAFARLERTENEITFDVDGSSV